MTPIEAKKRLAALRREIRAERISYGELAELQGMVPYIEPGDVELAEWAGIPEVDFHSGAYRQPGYDASARTAELAAEEDASFAEREAHESHGGAAGSFFDEGCSLCPPDDGPLPAHVNPEANHQHHAVPRADCHLCRSDEIEADGPFAIENWDGSR